MHGHIAIFLFVCGSPTQQKISGLAMRLYAMHHLHNRGKSDTTNPFMSRYVQQDHWGIT